MENELRGSWNIKGLIKKEAWREMEEKGQGWGGLVLRVVEDEFEIHQVSLKWTW